MPTKKVDPDFLSNIFGRLNYKPVLNQVSKPMSRNMTKAERKVWFDILSSNKTGYKFVKQKIIYKIIVDFYCSELLLAIEIDDSSHENKINQDISRDKFLKKMNITVLRIKNDEVYKSTEDVSKKIYRVIKHLATTTLPLRNTSESTP